MPQLLRYPHVSFLRKSIIPKQSCYNNINGFQWAYVRKYTMVGFDFKIKGCMFLDTQWFYLQHICLPTYRYITVKLKKHKITLVQRWSFYTGGL